MNEPVLHQAVKAFLNNQRQGTAKTKTRSFVSGGNQKPWKQKGTGRARQGSTRAPHWRGGGTVFGPIPRDYTHRRAAQGAGSSPAARAQRAGARGRAATWSRRSPSRRRTRRQLAGLLAKLGVDGQKVLVLTHGVNRNVFLSAATCRRCT